MRFYNLMEEPVLLRPVEPRTALRATEIKKLVAGGVIQPSLFDEVHLSEIMHPDDQGEHLVACGTSSLAEEEARTRADLLTATEANLATVKAGGLHTAGTRGLRAGRVVNEVHALLRGARRGALWLLPHGGGDRRRGRARWDLRDPRLAWHGHATHCRGPTGRRRTWSTTRSRT